jgi:hypothetical protein
MPYRKAIWVHRRDDPQARTGRHLIGMVQEMFQEQLSQKVGIGLELAVYVTDKGYLDRPVTDAVGADGAPLYRMTDDLFGAGGGRLGGQ